ncbi:MAG: ABC transporter permease [Bacteroidaceae bacterium]|nr:ABC transporter permease [Bacteroidaceae bacterium]MBQ9884272.1 ABC transporter permease [Bacteroidaceae bacterium]MBR1939765.1 ABC transporter permease [Bacteroidaceae bacterium]MBR1939788.1 ABC transporter permease [Bacteroidaceae bacterium]
MLRLIIKNLWARRKRNGWLLAELILVTVVSWAILDQTVVNFYVSHKPVGYDKERLLLMETAMIEKASPRYDAQSSDSISLENDFQRILSRLRTLDEIELVAPLRSYAFLESEGNSTSMFQTEADTTLQTYAARVFFCPGENYFDTYGIEPAKGSPSAKELSSLSYGTNDVVISRSLADYLFPQGNALNHYMNLDANDPDEPGYRIVGVVEDVAVRHLTRFRMTVFLPDYNRDMESDFMPHILIRMKEGVNVKAFCNKLNLLMPKELHAGNVYTRDLKTYQEQHDYLSTGFGFTSSMTLRYLLTAFFLVNLCLGVIGNFWLQTRKRTEEAGVMKSFGATSGHIVRMLLGEGWFLATVAVLIGCFIYLQYGWAEGLAVEPYSFSSYSVQKDWMDNFWSHFCHISAVVYVLITAVVLIGIYIPARNISKVNPVDALRDE